MATMEAERRAASEKSRRYYDSGEDDSEYDEDGVLVSSTRYSLQFAELEAHLALSVVREAFVTSAFHYWERSARFWTGYRGGSFRELTTAVMEKHSVHPELVTVNVLNNLLKHDNPQRALDLAALRDDVFRTAPHSALPSRRQTWALAISDRHVEEVFDIVAASGPAYAPRN